MVGCYPWTNPKDSVTPSESAPASQPDGADQAPRQEGVGVRGLVETMESAKCGLPELSNFTATPPEPGELPTKLEQTCVCHTALRPGQAGKYGRLKLRGILDVNLDRTGVSVNSRFPAWRQVHEIFLSHDERGSL
jgi:hypothetical protein